MKGGISNAGSSNAERADGSISSDGRKFVIFDDVSSSTMNKFEFLSLVQYLCRALRRSRNMVSPLPTISGKEPSSNCLASSITSMVSGRSSGSNVVASKLEKFHTVWR